MRACPFLPSGHEARSPAGSDATVAVRPGGAVAVASEPAAARGTKKAAPSAAAAAPITAVCAGAWAGAESSPRGCELSASVLMTTPIWLIRRLDFDTPYHNWTVYHRAHGPHLT